MIAIVVAIAAGTVTGIAAVKLPRLSPPSRQERVLPPVVTFAAIVAVIDDVHVLSWII